MAPRPCPCGLQKTYADCCGRFHRGEAAATTAELLMRSRYSAFSVGDEAYLLRTWHPDVRPQRVGLDRKVRWTGLEVLETTGGSPFHTEGTVHFRAHSSDGVVEENSKFTRFQGAWVYCGT
ncbi:YchJ family protein [Nonomuraea sp. NPDC050556]|uniref:YchJ family protein n=1 Tax=Nonomuraea sp. NPDC050556 TaxID=3364369 RepID=UPI0037B5834F